MGCGPDFGFRAVNSGLAKVTDYTPEQLQQIRLAVAQGREAMRAAGRFEPLVFARAFVAAGGVQVPGAAGDDSALGAELLRALEQNAPTTGDARLAREIERARNEARWAQLAESDTVVGFHLRLPPAALLDPKCREILKADRGLGAAVFRKGEIVVLPTACDGASFTPVYEHEIEQ